MRRRRFGVGNVGEFHVGYVVFKALNADTQVEMFGRHSPLMC